MASLSPYIAKFAGYRIADGRLDLDLHYEVENGLLEGRNEIVLRQVKLGEKVDSPSALDIPIELALAVLKDRNGVIDIGLPVSGNLDSPKFDYGEVIRKAIGRVLGNIVSAPFKALAGLFGGGGEDTRLGSVDFEPGSVSIAPPEREKLDAVARALKERPQLRLVVPPTYASAGDRPALKSRTVRAELLRRMGTELAPGEEPGPIDPDDPRAQHAIQALFSARYAPAVFSELARRARAEPQAAGAHEPAAEPAAAASENSEGGSAVAASGNSGSGSAAAVSSNGGSGSAAAASLGGDFYRRLLDRLIAEQTVEEADLKRLAERRGQAVVAALTGPGGVSAERVALGEPQAAADERAQTVTMNLQLEATP